jgi:hypothetical protein
MAFKAYFLLATFDQGNYRKNPSERFKAICLAQIGRKRLQIWISVIRYNLIPKFFDYLKLKIKKKIQK